MQGLGMIDGKRKITTQLFSGPASIVGVNREVSADSKCRETIVFLKLLAPSKKPYPPGDRFQPGLGPSMTFTSGEKFWKAPPVKPSWTHILIYLRTSNSPAYFHCLVFHSSEADPETKIQMWAVYKDKQKMLMEKWEKVAKKVQPEKPDTTMVDWNSPQGISGKRRTVQTSEVSTHGVRKT